VGRLQIKTRWLKRREKGFNRPPLPVEPEHPIGTDSTRGQNVKRVVLKELDPKWYFDRSGFFYYLLFLKKWKRSGSHV
jgi:hypothetical protein